MLEEAKRKLSLQRKEQELLNDLTEQANEEDHPESPHLSLAQIEEDEEDESTVEQAKNLIRKGADPNTIELVSP